MGGEAFAIWKKEGQYFALPFDYFTYVSSIP